VKLVRTLKAHTEQAFEVELFPKATDLVVKKSNCIVGNTGSSEGPHLHFEFVIVKLKNYQPMLDDKHSHKTTKLRPIQSQRDRCLVLQKRWNLSS
jgi:hypothetical protein